MSDTIRQVYLYDGTFEGFLCCVFESYMKKETPVDIVPDTFEQFFLYPIKEIETDHGHADRVFRSFDIKMSPEVTDFIKCGFLTCHPKKEMLMYRFIRKGYRVGGGIIDCLTDPDVHELYKAVKHLKNEAHLLRGFIRFGEYNKTLVSVIAPKNWVLPLLAEHFSDRYNGETFMIYDEVHHSALIYHPYEWMLVPIDDFTLPEADAEELLFQQLWQRFYKTIGIKQRFNPKCQMTHMPKRYWSHTVEHQPEGLAVSGEKRHLSGS